LRSHWWLAHMSRIGCGEAQTCFLRVASLMPIELQQWQPASD
jgi:hypothetical protein